ncbi:unnamed protein product [Bartonella choladocola]|uniref:portal protein n=1 Tax=Bartonella choladocola TaxID=2750995 RepID=UPI003997DA35
MFDLNADDGSVRIKKSQSPMPHVEKPQAEPVTANKLDSDKMVELHKKLLGYYRSELDRSAENRAEQAEDEQFYDNIQWSAKDAAVLRERNQMPLVYNVISSSIDWVTGTEKRARTDFKILPRRKEDAKAAQRKTELMKYLSDVNRTQFDISRCFEDATKVGIGWMEDGVDFNTENEPIFSKYESWRNILWDTAATELDLSDARYIFRTKWVDLDIALAMFPKRANVLRRAATTDGHIAGGDLYGDTAMDDRETDGSGVVFNDGNRPRVRMIEAWFRMPATVKRLSGGMFSGEIYDEFSEAHNDAIKSGEATLSERTSMVMNVAVLTASGMLWFSQSPYRHNRFPFTPVWAYKKGDDGMPYGMVRRLKDLQRDINKRASKALHILSSNKVIMDEGAVADVNNLMDEVARPDALLVVKANKRFDLTSDRDLAPAHLELMSRDISMIQQASGVTDELMGRKTNAVSGIAIQSRQQQGSLVTAKLFDNLQLFAQVRGEKQLSLIEQFMSEKKQFRITNQRGQPEYIEVNDGLPENDITKSKADFLISEADWQTTLRQSQANQLMDMATKLPPQVMMVILDLIVENLDVVNADEIVKRIRSVTGQRDPDADEEQMTAEEQQKQAAQQQQAQLQQQQTMLQLQSLQADVAKKTADAQKAAAQAAQFQANTVRTNIDAQANALTAAGMALQTPAAVDTADGLLAESGFLSPRQRQEQEQQMQEQLQQQQAQLQQKHAAQQQMPVGDNTQMNMSPETTDDDMATATAGRSEE